VENGFIESFNGRLRDECLNVEWFSSLDDAERKLANFREHYNRERPHSALADRTPAAFAALHMEKASTLMGRALQSLLMEPLECTKTASTSGRKDLHCPKPLVSFVTENGSGPKRKLSYDRVGGEWGQVRAIPKREQPLYYCCAPGVCVDCCC
jgi:hypothetical protein